MGFFSGLLEKGGPFFDPVLKRLYLVLNSVQCEDVCRN